MNGRHPLKLTLLVLGGVVLVALLIWSATELWRYVEEHDANPSRDGLKEQMMQRKARAMEDITDALAQGRLDQVGAAVSRMDEYASTIKRFLATDVYETHGEDFEDAIRDLQSAVDRQDQPGAEAATERLQRTCLDCHAGLSRTP
jgi:FtsZ-interacting cell division protein ZipA